ncbi:MAG: single-stranded DNA-binding protein [Clostridiales bacterium]|nr:single-stranded DNA-binding protein [Clostridiales bacterium]
MNVVVLTGNLARDPEKSVTGTGMTVVRFTIAVNRFGKKDGGDSADFIRCTAFDKQAELVLQYLAKGRKAGVEGRIQTGSYTDKDGKKVYTTDVIANRVEFLDSKGQGEGGGYTAPFETRLSGDFEAAPPSALDGTSAGAGALPSGFAEMDEEDDDMPF